MTPAPVSAPKRILAATLALALAFGLVSLLRAAVRISAQSTPQRHDMIVLLDNSGTMVRTYRVDGSQIIPYDVGQDRIRFTRFMVRLLQQTRPDDHAVGAALFGAAVTSTHLANQPSTIVLAPLMLVQNWTAADVAAIHQQECPAWRSTDAQGQPLPFRIGSDYCYGTRYLNAFEWAAQQLATGGACGDVRRCSILLFTDGNLGEPNSDNQMQVERGLDGLLSQGIDVSAILFAHEGVTPARLGAWQDWQRGGRIQGLDTYTRDQGAADLYRRSLQLLDMDSLLEGFESLQLPQNDVVLTERLAPNVASLRLQMISDGVITETFGVPPTIAGSGERWWLQPDFKTLTASFDGKGLLYYRVSQQTAPVEVLLNLSPLIQTVGKPVVVQALVQSQGRHLGAGELQGITAVANPGGQEIELVAQDDDSWSGQTTDLEPGTYDLTFELQPRGWRLADAPEVRGQTHFRIETGGQWEAILNGKPAIQFAGQPVAFNVIAKQDGAVAAFPSGTSVTARLLPKGPSFSLASADNVIWTTSEAITRAGNYSVTVDVAGAGVQVSSLPVPLEIAPVPELTLLLSRHEAKPGEEIMVTVLVTSSTPLTPTVVAVDDAEYREKVELAALGMSRFQGKVSMPVAGALLLAAELVDDRGETMSGSLVSRSKFVSRTPEPSQRKLAIAGGITSSLFAIIALVLGYRALTRPTRNIAFRLIKGEMKWEQVENLNIDENMDNVRLVAKNIVPWLQNLGK